MTTQNRTAKQNIAISLKKARSLLDTIIRMTQEDKYCVDIMQQNLAVIGLLKSAHEQLMTNHLETCFTAAMQSKTDRKKQEMVGEIKTLMKMYNK
jgi:CsoR family transcriptional regulator, copper-sensing transcriptional repressor